MLSKTYMVRMIFLYGKNIYVLKYFFVEKGARILLLSNFSYQDPHLFRNIYFVKTVSGKTKFTRKRQTAWLSLGLCWAANNLWSL